MRFGPRGSAFSFWENGENWGGTLASSSRSKLARAVGPFVFSITSPDIRFPSSRLIAQQHGRIEENIYRIVLLKPGDQWFRITIEYRDAGIRVEQIHVVLFSLRIQRDPLLEFTLRGKLEFFILPFPCDISKESFWPGQCHFLLYQLSKTVSVPKSFRKPILLMVWVWEFAE